jgi:hypothetical protein
MAHWRRGKAAHYEGGRRRGGEGMGPKKRERRVGRADEDGSDDDLGCKYMRTCP